MLVVSVTSVQYMQAVLDLCVNQLRPLILQHLVSCPASPTTKARPLPPVHVSGAVSVAQSSGQFPCQHAGPIIACMRQEQGQR